MTFGSKRHPATRTPFPLAFESSVALHSNALALVNRQMSDREPHGMLHEQDTPVLSAPFFLFFLLSEQSGEEDTCRFIQVCSRCTATCGSTLEEGAALENSASIPSCEPVPMGTAMSTRGGYRQRRSMQFILWLGGI